MAKKSQELVQWFVGLLCSMILALMLYQSGGPETNYGLVSIVGMLALIALLLKYHELIIAALQIWRGDSVDTSSLEELLKSMDADSDAGGTDTGKTDTDTGDERDGDGNGGENDAR